MIIHDLHILLQSEEGDRMGRIVRIVRKGSYVFVLLHRL
jgi:hypothetical protein